MKENKHFRFLLAAVLILFIQNTYLIVKVNETSKDAKYARSYASNAEDHAKDALRYAKYAADYSESAMNYAEDASDYAEEASYRAFANVCSFCP